MTSIQTNPFIKIADKQQFMTCFLVKSQNLYFFLLGMSAPFVTLEEKQWANLTEQFMFNLFNLSLPFTASMQGNLSIQLLEKQGGVVHSWFTHSYIYTCYLLFTFLDKQQGVGQSCHSLMLPRGWPPLNVKLYTCCTCTTFTIIMQ